MSGKASREADCSGGSKDTKDGLDAAQVLGGLSDQLMDAKMKENLDLVDVTFTCKVCNVKAKSLAELMGHMKDGQCTAEKKRPRGRPRKTEEEKLATPKPKPAVVSNLPSDRVTRVKSGAIKRKSVADLFIKQESMSSEDETVEETGKRRKRRFVNSQTIDIEDDEDEDYIIVKEKTLTGTEALAANKDAKLSGHEVRIPIGSIRQGEAKIIKLHTSTPDDPNQLTGQLLQITQVDNQPVVQILTEEKEIEKANAEIFLRTGVKKSEKESEEGEAETPGPDDNIQLVEINMEELEEMRKSGNLKEMEVLNPNESGPTEPDEVTELTELSNVVKSEVTAILSQNEEYQPPQQQRRRYTKLPAAKDYDSDRNNQQKNQGIGGLKCKKCVQRFFQTQEEHDVHFRLHIKGKELGYKCDKCSFTVDNWGRMQGHIIKHPEYAEQLRGTYMMRNIFGSFQCPVCGIIFELKSSLSYHYKQNHSEDNTRMCEHCNQIFHNIPLKRFERHVDKCKGEELNCHLCSYTTNVRSNLQTHLRVHSGEGFVCDICDKVFPTKQRHEIHRERHIENRQRYTCEVCSADFCSKDAVKKHFQRMHTEKDLTYHCTICEYQTKQEMDFKKHMKTVHERKFLCSVDGCEYGTNREDKLTLHAEFHNPDRVFKCSYVNCYTAFSSQRSLANHMQNIHKLGCKHQCPICMKFFKKKTTLLRHLVSHTNERPYSCLECSMTFTCHSTYYRHRNKTGHDAKREGVTSVPQNITIQYIDSVPESPLEMSYGAQQQQQQHHHVGPVEGMTVVSQMTDEGTGGETIHQTTEDGTSLLTIPSTSLLTMNHNTGAMDHHQQQQQQQQQEHQIITIDAAQFELFQQQQRQMNDDSNVTYYVYDNGDGAVGGVDDPEREREMLGGIQFSNNDTEEDMNMSQFINLDLPSGPALVKVDESGELMVMNTFGQSIQTREIVAGTDVTDTDTNPQINTEIVTDNASDLLQLNDTQDSQQGVEFAEQARGLSINQQHQQVVYHDMDYLEGMVNQDQNGGDGAEMVQNQEAGIVMTEDGDQPQQYVIIKQGGEGGDGTEGESVAAYGMLQLHGGKEVVDQQVTQL